MKHRSLLVIASLALIGAVSIVAAPVGVNKLFDAAEKFARAYPATVDTSEPPLSTFARALMESPATGGAIQVYDAQTKTLRALNGVDLFGTAPATIPAAMTVTGATTPTGGVAAAGGFTFSPSTCHTGGVPAQISTDGTDLAVVVTELYVAQVFIPANCTVTGVSAFWGSATNGNAKVMLFNSRGTRVAISATTDVSAYANDSYGSRIAFSTAYAAKGPATYYVGVMCDDNTNKLNTHILGNFGAGKITGLVYATEAGYSTITPPTTFTTGLGPIATLY